jgi:hypothetical protein
MRFARLLLALSIPAAAACATDCDEASRWNHSRNFVSGWMNFLVFDNGFHTATSVFRSAGPPLDLRDER